MSDFLTLDSVKNALVECPICTEYFHADTRIPRRMPCCNQTICQPCLETYSGIRQIITCPLCCQQLNLGVGVKSLPREMVVLRFLDLLENQKNFLPSCTDCPNQSIAQAKCDTCGILLCQGCLKSHHKNPQSDDHITVTFERARREQQDRRKTVRQLHSSQHTHDNSFDEKSRQLGDRINELHDLEDNISQSEAAAEEQINQVFDELTEELNQRRKALLSQLKTVSEKESREVTSALDSHQVLQFKLQKAQRSRKTVSSILFEETPQDVNFVKKGITFVADNVQQLVSSIRETGVVRSVTFTPTERPQNIDEASHCNAVEIEPAALPKDLTMDQVLMLDSVRHAKPVICPHLEFDPNTAGHDIIISGPVAVNSKPKHPFPKTGCRLQAPRTVMVSRPYIHEDETRYMCAVKVNFSLKQSIPVRKAIMEIALTSSPIDMNFSQIKGMSVSVASCHFHSQHKNDLCLVIETNVERIYCQPLVRNDVGTERTGELNIALVIDYGRNTIHVLDLDWDIVLATVHKMPMVKPLWTMMYLGRPEWTDVRGELVSGHRLQASRNLMGLLAAL